MSRYTFTAEDNAKSQRTRGVGPAARLRRQMELTLLDKLHVELAMPEWYPER